MPDGKRSEREALVLSTVGITLVLCTAIGTGAGFVVDRHYASEPIATVIGFLVGTAAGFVQLLRAVKGR